jgi:hypothetical protein
MWEDGYKAVISAEREHSTAQASWIVDHIHYYFLSFRLSFPSVSNDI